MFYDSEEDGYVESDVAVVVVKSSSKSLLVRLGNGTQHALPKSKIHKTLGHIRRESSEGDEGILVVARSWASARGVLEAE